MDFRLTIRMDRKDLVARKSRSMAMFRAAEPPLAKGASGKISGHNRRDKNSWPEWDGNWKTMGKCWKMKDGNNRNHLLAIKTMSFADFKR